VRAAGQLPRPAAERYLQTLSRGRWDRRAATYAPAFAVQLDDAATAGVVLGPWEREPSGVLLDRMLAVELASHLPGDLLVKMDVATMAVALEARSPLLDHELLELAAALPERLRVDGPRKKVALRAALRGWVPDAVLDKPKQGFQVPLAAWLRGPLGPRVAHALDDPAAAVHRYVRPEVSRVALTDHLAGRADHGSFLWSLLVLQTWHEEVVDRPAEVPARVLA
jgi:asparagine synthase (glutamine-hydrolysing)